jgi:hypothetical protein
MGIIIESDKEGRSGGAGLFPVLAECARGTLIGGVLEQMRDMLRIGR